MLWRIGMFYRVFCRTKDIISPSWDCAVWCFELATTVHAADIRKSTSILSRSIAKLASSRDESNEEKRKETQGNSCNRVVLERKKFES